MNIKSYKELIKINDYRERFEYLKLNGSVGFDTFGKDRVFNQFFYTSVEWKQSKDKIIIRDQGLDMAFPDYEIIGSIFVHHINPITIKDIEKGSEKLFDPDNLICVSRLTHNAIHYGSYDLIQQSLIVKRSPNDTLLWKSITTKR